jgi:hypothetical protein
MNFITIGQYFNKLQIVFFILLILPLLVFIAIHFLNIEPLREASPEILTLIPFLALLEWFLAIVIFNKKIKSARNQQGLGAKLAKYFNITIVRNSFLASSGLMLAAGYLITHNDAFTGLYVVNVILTLFFWPSGPRVAGELMLKGDERDMVYFKKDKL